MRPIFAPDPTPEERQHIRKFGGYIRGMWNEPQLCPTISWKWWRNCRTAYGRKFRLLCVCSNPLGHQDFGTPHACKCGHTWMDRQLRRTRRRVLRERNPQSLWLKFLKHDNDLNVTRKNKES